MSQDPRPRITIPEPEFRPGDAPDYSKVALPQAGAVTLPPLDVEPRLLRNHAFSIIRILRRDGEAVGPWATMLSDDELLAGLRHMMILRVLDARMIAAQRQGKTSFYVPQLGEEAVTIAFQRALKQGRHELPDLSQCRAAGGAGLSARNHDEPDLFQREGSARRAADAGAVLRAEYGFFTVSGNLGTQFVQAVGWAMAAAIDGSDRDRRRLDRGRLDGGIDFHSAMVFASTYKPPVILNIVNNQWAISTFQGIAKGDSGTFAARALGFGMAALRVDGNDFLAVHAVAKWAARRAREGLGPTVIEHVTYRAGGHSTSDNPEGLPPASAESDAWPLGDPIERLKLHLIQARALVGRASRPGRGRNPRHRHCRAERPPRKTARLHSGPSPRRRSIFDGLYEETPLHLRRQKEAAEKWLGQ